MKFQKRFGNRKRTNSKRGLFLVVLLALALYLFFNADKILSRIL
ncbi:hypothetical protein [uncultured Tenacibaculum sp.]|nr:hypothetical protein [uncultured Tenacibaculum sp.]